MTRLCSPVQRGDDDCVVTERRVRHLQGDERGSAAYSHSSERQKGSLAKYSALSDGRSSNTIFATTTALAY